MDQSPGGVLTAPLVRPIHLPLPLKMGSVNCYLVETGSGFILIDSGAPGQRLALERILEDAGCRPGKLSLIVLTHGDFDHTGSAAHLAQKLGAPIGMHHADWAMLERGDMFAGRTPPNPLLRVAAGAAAPLLFGFGRAERARPDLDLQEGFDLRDFGLHANIIHIPGHSPGSIGVLTANGDLFCGDLLENSAGPAPGSIVDDKSAAASSLARLRTLGIQTVYPGHGLPFAMHELAP